MGELDRCSTCGALSLRPCPRRACQPWHRARRKFLQLTHVPEMPLRRSAGKFVVGWDWER